MTTANDLIESTRRYLFTGQSEEINRLAATIDASVTAFTVDFDIGGITAGSIVSIDLEEIYVFSAAGATKQITDCVRGYNGTTAAAHTDGALITVRPKFSPFRILEALNHELADLSSPVNGLYQILSVDLTFNATRYGYDLTNVEDIIDIAEVRFRTVGPEKTWPKIDSYALLRNMPTSGQFGDFPSGNALVIYESAMPGYPIHVRYKAPFGLLEALSDDVLEMTGLPTSAHDIPAMGAAIRLVASREVKRNFDEVQGEPRRADEVPPGASMQSIAGLVRMRQQRIQAEAARLTKAYGYSLIGVA